jgi:hypothetical protein
MGSAAKKKSIISVVNSLPPFSPALKLDLRPGIITCMENQIDIPKRIHYQSAIETLL